MSKYHDGSATPPTQAEIDMLTKTVALLDQDNLLCVITNAIMLHDEGSLLSLVHRLKTIMITVAAISGDDVLKGKVIDMLRDSADLFEKSVMKKTLN